MKRSANYILRAVGDISVLVPTNTVAGQSSELVRLNATGSFIWHLLADDLTAEQLSLALAARFKMPSAVTDLDVRRVLDTANACQIVEL